MISDMDERLAQILPLSTKYKYSVESFKEPMSDSEAFNSIFTVNVNNEEEFSEWLNHFQKKSNTKFNTCKTVACDGRYVTFKKTYKCHHNVKGGVIGRGKHTSCNAKAAVTIRHCPKRIRKDRTKVHPDGLCLIDLRWEHNHPLLAANVIRHYSVSPEINEELIWKGVDLDSLVVDKSDELEQKIATVNELFKVKVHDVARQNPEAFFEAYKVFLDTLQSLSTPDAIASALRNFGNYSGGRKRVGKRLSGMSVRSTAIARRQKLLRASTPEMLADLGNLL